MTEKNSLYEYKGNLTSGQPANNFNRPNLNYKNGGRLESTNWNTIKSSTPSVNWNGYRSSDPILRFGNTSSSLSGGGFLNTLGNIASGISLFGGVAMTAVGIATAVKTIKGANNSAGNSNAVFSRKESKEINRNTSNTDDAMNALD